MQPNLAGGVSYRACPCWPISKRCYWPMCIRCCPRACWDKRCTTSPLSGASSSATSKTGATASTTTSRKRDSPVLRRQAQLVICRHRGRSQRQREPVLASSNLPGQWDRRLPVPAGAVHRVAPRAVGGRLRRAPALAHPPGRGLSGIYRHTVAAARTRFIDRIRTFIENLAQVTPVRTRFWGSVHCIVDTCRPALPVSSMGPRGHAYEWRASANASAQGSGHREDSMTLPEAGEPLHSFW